MADPPRSVAGVEPTKNMFNVYVLKSLKNGRRYIGLTGQGLEERLKQHQSGSTQWTRQNGPFQLIYTEQFLDKRSAQNRERFLKSGHGREFLNRIIPSLRP